ncbi:FecR family protein [Pedobacter montanisoli]|uniref:FecR domain-containing protein n=1 Tax=Pedobacter montanisoli TaxID=2923277 RepID=A0ABS9ZXW0_9SPHI|nr:FecR domain-containing protein [Pedobacter montanisoli]MCJ0743166.1 FecR domain-containing protein [Pedobacter montanisoli]
MDDELLIKFLLKETSEKENAEVQDWISADGENEKYFKQLEQIWNESAGLAIQSSVDEELAWQKFKTRVVPKEENILPAQLKVKRNNSNLKWLSIAATLFIVAGAWLVYSLIGSGYTEVSSEALVVNKALPDGSQLVLNKNTTLSYADDFKQNRKVLLLRGEVFFDVAHDRSHPFTISMDQVNVRVVGTSFNIKRNANSIEVIVESGVVKVKKNQSEISLVKGERITIGTDAKAQLVKQVNEDELYNYYRTQLFVARNTPLYRLVNVLNEAYGVQIVPADDIKGLRIYTTLPFNNLDKNLNNICDALDLEIQRNQNQILLSKKRK